MKLDGKSLTLPAIVAAARFPSSSLTGQPGGAPRVFLTEDATARSQVDKSRQVIDTKMEAGKSVYGVSTGFGGSGGFISFSSQLYFNLDFLTVNTYAADTRTDQNVGLGLSLLQHQHVGILPSDLQKSLSASDDYGPEDPMPLLPPLATSMPPPWVRGALIVRANSLVRGHSGVRWRLVESMVNLLNKDVIPVRYIFLCGLCLTYADRIDCPFEREY